MNKEKLFEEIQRVSLLKGYFVLRSGQHSTEYFNKYLFESSPILLKAVAEHLKMLVPSDTEILAGLEMGGIPLAVSLSLTTELPVVFVRKKAKEYGTKKITEGCSIEGKRVCIVEDVITTGGQVIKSTQSMRKEGAFIESVICVIYRGGADSLQKLQEAHLKLHPLFTWSQAKKP